MTDREENVFMAVLAERAERFNEMLEPLKKVVHLDVELNEEERNLFSIAYKNVIGPRKASWRVFNHLEKKEENLLDGKRLEIIKHYKLLVETEIKEICHEVLNILDEHIIPNTAEQESKVFFLKLKGDYNRYLAEITEGDECTEVSDDSLIAYQAAKEIAMSELPPTNPTRLGLALNFSVYYFEISESLNAACRLAKEALDYSIAELYTLNEEDYKAATFVMQLIRDNLTRWNSMVETDQIYESEELSIDQISDEENVDDEEDSGESGDGEVDDQSEYLEEGNDQNGIS